MKPSRRKIVDTHFHLWDLQANYYPWLTDRPQKMIIGDYTPIMRNYLVGDLLRDMGDLDVVAGVHVQAEHDYRDHVRETRWLQQVADSEGSLGLPQGIVGNADLQADDAAQVLAAHCSHRNMRGIRQALHRGLHADPPYDPLLDPRWRANFHLLERHDLLFEVQAFPGQARHVVDLMREHPGVRFVFTHCGLPLWRSDEALAQWRTNLRLYAQQPNAHLKISGFGTFDRNWTTVSMRDTALFCLDTFGIDRCVLASNHPVESLARPYRYVWDSFGEWFKDLSSTDQDRLFWQNALGLYRLEARA